MLPRKLEYPTTTFPDFQNFLREQERVTVAECDFFFLYIFDDERSLRAEPLPLPRTSPSRFFSFQSAFVDSGGSPLLSFFFFLTTVILLSLLAETTLYRCSFPLNKSDRSRCHGMKKKSSLGGRTESKGPSLQRSTQWF